MELLDLSFSSMHTVRFLSWVLSTSCDATTSNVVLRSSANYNHNINIVEHVYIITWTTSEKQLTNSSSINIYIYTHEYLSRTYIKVDESNMAYPHIFVRKLQFDHVVGVFFLILCLNLASSSLSRVDFMG